ncbi:hypothetical protein EYF80_047048 [Liparis tanakae]|uniref:Uncharacterized protein n=1 Tax=Liparis tanakae TaxID=230148 RepID=A0A4Z2FQX4_9TELE|nr:hypothetical protein EYF80_047048 [Liparis tanakae]
MESLKVRRAMLRRLEEGTWSLYPPTLISSGTSVSLRTTAYNPLVPHVQSDGGGRTTFSPRGQRSELSESPEG